MLKRLKNNRASGYIDVVVVILSAMLVLALAVGVLPVYLTKSQLDTFAQELCREAEICGEIGSQTTSRELVLREKTGLVPTVTWSKTGNIQLNEEFTVTVAYEYDIGFGGFGSWPIVYDMQKGYVPAKDSLYDEYRKMFRNYRNWMNSEAYWKSLQIAILISEIYQKGEYKDV